MKQVRLAIQLVLFLLLAILWQMPHSAHAAAIRTGQPAPNFKVITTSGQTVTLENYNNHVLVIDFFATWCAPCRQSVPHLVALNSKYGKQGLQVLGLSADEDGERLLRAFSAEHRINYPLALAGESVQADYGVRSVPVMFVIDKKGNVAEIYRGFSDEKGRSMERLIKKLLVEK